LASGRSVLAVSRTGAGFDPSSFEPRPGTYALLLRSARRDSIQAGKLGILHLQPGWYVYVGSAHGSGGGRARLAHHLRLAERPHWHIDYLRLHAPVEAIWFTYSRRTLEHRWADAISLMTGAAAPLPGFGSSDCDCTTHLFFFARRPSAAALRSALSVGL
jgi:Uri superfamily endonuclease